MVVVFVAFWLVLGLGIVVLAMGRTGASRRDQPGPHRTVLIVGIAAVSVFFGGVLPALAISHGTRTDATAKGVELSDAQVKGRYIFTEHCAGCHTLAASKTAGITGPNLDAIRPPAALVVNAVEQGRARGAGLMPARLLSGDDVRDVADYVSAVAGH